MFSLWYHYETRYLIGQRVSRHVKESCFTCIAHAQLSTILPAKENHETSVPFHRVSTKSRLILCTSLSKIKQYVLVCVVLGRYQVAFAMSWVNSASSLQLCFDWFISVGVREARGRRD